MIYGNGLPAQWRHWVHRKSSTQVAQAKVWIGATSTKFCQHIQQLSVQVFRRQVLFHQTRDVIHLLWMHFPPCPLLHQWSDPKTSYIRQIPHKTDFTIQYAQERGEVGIPNTSPPNSCAPHQAEQRVLRCARVPGGTLQSKCALASAWHLSPIELSMQPKLEKWIRQNVHYVRTQRKMPT